MAAQLVDDDCDLITWVALCTNTYVAGVGVGVGVGVGGDVGVYLWEQMVAQHDLSGMRLVPFPQVFVSAHAKGSRGRAKFGSSASMGNLSNIGCVL